MRRFSSLALPLILAGAAALGYIGCNPDTTTTGFNCGPGTAPDDKNECIPVPDTGPGDAPATAPTFSGVKAVAPASSTSLFVTWAPATDAVTPAPK